MNQPLTVSHPPNSVPWTALVLVDLCESELARYGSGIAITRALANCQAALSHARGLGIPIAFVQPFKSAESRSEGQWIAGFRPGRSEMVFFRSALSCYSSPAFVDMMAHASCGIALAGLSADTVLLATALEAHHRQHRLCYLHDASISESMRGTTEKNAKEIVSGIIRSFAEVVATETWIAETKGLRRDVGYPQEGKSRDANNQRGGVE